MITAISKEAFIAAAWDVVGRKVSKHSLVSDIYETAVASVGLPVDEGSDAIRMFRMVLAEGRSLIRQRRECQKICVRGERRHATLKGATHDRAEEDA